VVVVCGWPLTAADKVDVVNLRNGDRVTCEIKALDRSVLTISTDPLGKVSVHWGEISDLRSPRQFDVQVASGDHYLGSILASTPGQMVLALAGGGTTTLALNDVIRLAPIGTSLWSRVDGNLDAGFSFTQANVETQWTLNGQAAYRSPKYALRMTASSQIRTREDADPIKRNSLSLTAARSRENRWYTAGLAQFQQNEELSLHLRIVAGGGVGRDLVHTTRRLWSLFGGVAYTHENFAAEPVDESAEGVAGLMFDFFTPGKEDFQISNTLLSYVNLSGRKRVRLELQQAWRHEFLKDFYWSFNLFDSFDGDPPADEKKNDFGVSFTLGWKF
jgi:hypothetical protein